VPRRGPQISSCHYLSTPCQHPSNKPLPPARCQHGATLAQPRWREALREMADFAAQQAELGSDAPPQVSSRRRSRVPGATSPRTTSPRTRSRRICPTTHSFQVVRGPGPAVINTHNSGSEARAPRKFLKAINSVSEPEWPSRRRVCRVFICSYF